MNKDYSMIFWGKDRSSQVVFRPCNEVETESNSITSCMCAVFDGDNMLLTKPERGWGLPGGHLESGESATDCIKRECWEEAAITMTEPYMIGYWEIKKIKKKKTNAQYPDKAYQILFLSKVEQVFDFKQTHETEDRIFVKPKDVKNYHHAYKDFKKILDYILSVRQE